MPPPMSSSAAPSATSVRPPAITATRDTSYTTSTDCTSRRFDSTSTGAYSADCEPGRYTSGVDAAVMSSESVTVSTDPAENVPVSAITLLDTVKPHIDSSTGTVPAPPITYSTAPLRSDTFCTTIRTPSLANHGTKMAA
ncbi:mucin-2 precursor [Trypanosoma grayi]|uniref:mucin-2 precursor n=1 Tax=Trypanosoma grayi TaxID=71804 RepID=UPI0004F49CDE|nr:mucin-2 precursor [Trypanosoma grayi]KEG06295.1 mucin-2 precursor [Trypanosoma grayi]